MDQELYEQVLEWECNPAANGSVDLNDSTKYGVKQEAGRLRKKRSGGHDGVLLLLKELQKALANLGSGHIRG